MIRFTKMHGNGNDFVLVDEIERVQVEEDKKPEFVRAISHRYFGLGCDGVLFVQRSRIADVKFRYFNSDGSEAEMCGNGIRCFTRYVIEEGYAKSPVRIETLAGIIETECWKDEEGWWIKVNMGNPKFGKEIPSRVDVWGWEFEFKNQKYRVFGVNTGVPHAVLFVNNLDFDITPVARFLRYNSIFPEGVNVNFARMLKKDSFEVRTYERGVEAETLSCGTGSVAVAVVANKLGLAGKRVDVLTKGGKLKVEIADKTAFLIGQASRIADGYINPEELRYEVS